MRHPALAGVAAGLAAILLCWPGMPVAATYQLQVASVSESVFTYFVEDQTLPRMEAYLESRGSRFVLFRDRQPQALEFSGPGRSIQFPVNVALSKRNDPWGPTTWEGEPGQVAVFRVRGLQSDHQKLRRVAVQTNGVLTRYPVRDTPGARSGPVAVPAAAADYLTRALQAGAFPAWVERRAKAYDGLSVIVGRHHNAQESDTVYLYVRMPRDGQAYKVILGWKTVRREGVYANTQHKRN